jgi:hypothetical protein
VSAPDAGALRDVARAAAAAGARVALDWQRRASELHVEEKAASDDLVSEADREAEPARTLLVNLSIASFTVENAGARPHKKTASVEASSATVRTRRSS